MIDDLTGSKYAPSTGANGPNINLAVVTILRILILCSLVAINPEIFFFRNPCLYTLLYWFAISTTVIVFYKVSLTDPGYLNWCPSVWVHDADGIEMSTVLEENVDFGNDSHSAQNSRSDTPSVVKRPYQNPRETSSSLLETAPPEPQTYKWIDGVLCQFGKNLRHCEGCEMWQPLRTKHCRDCERCVLTHDHHCPWIGTCVGEKNRRYFFTFLVVQFVELVWTAFEFIKALYYRPTIWVLMTIAAISFLSISILLSVFVTCLLVYQCFLASANFTTWENIRGSRVSYLSGAEDVSPFSRGLLSNLKDYFFAPTAHDGMIHWQPGKATVPCLVKHTCNKCRF